MRKFLLGSKLALLLVVIGFFQPVACSQNGLDITKCFFQQSQFVYAICFLAIIVAALIGAIFGICAIYKLKAKNQVPKENAAVNWGMPLLGMAAIATFFIYYKVTQGGEFAYIKQILQSGAYFILTGYVASFVLLIVDVAAGGKSGNSSVSGANQTVNSQEKELWVSKRIIELISEGKSAGDAKIQAEAEFTLKQPSLAAESTQPKVRELTPEELAAKKEEQKKILHFAYLGGAAAIIVSLFIFSKIYLMPYSPFMEKSPSLGTALCALFLPLAFAFGMIVLTLIKLPKLAIARLVLPIATLIALIPASSREFRYVALYGDELNEVLYVLKLLLLVAGVVVAIVSWVKNRDYEFTPKNPDQFKKIALIASIALGVVWLGVFGTRFAIQLKVAAEEKARIAAEKKAREEHIAELEANAKFEMIQVNGGTFRMGDKNNSAERPVHKVTVNSFSLGETEVTQALFELVMDRTPFEFRGYHLPADTINWYDAIVFCNRLSEKEGLTPVYSVNGSTNPDTWGYLPCRGNAFYRRIEWSQNANGYRLPTEAEWEYAARGGEKSKGYKFSGSNKIGEVAWNVDNSNDRTHEVKTKSPNELGFYDMSGNVYEWCWNVYEDYTSKAQDNPEDPDSGELRVPRGGSFGNGAKCRVTMRYGGAPEYGDKFIGFRVARSDNN